jgi:hypothetical protein
MHAATRKYAAAYQDSSWITGTWDSPKTSSASETAITHTAANAHGRRTTLDVASPNVMEALYRFNV